MKPLIVLFSCVFAFSVSTKSQTNYCLSFDGVNDYANIGNILPAVSDFTIECWVKVPSTATGTCYFLGSNTGTCAGNILQYSVAFNTLTFYERLNCTGVGVDYAVTLHDNTWHHLAGVRSGTSLYLYVDGKQVGTGTAYNNTGMTTFRLGNRISTYYQGLIEEVRIWSVARTAQQIKSGMYNTVAASTSGLMAYYGLNEGSGQTVGDATTNAYNGTVGANSSVAGNDPAWAASPVQFGNNAVSFDGVNDYVSIPAAAIDNLPSGTIEAVVYLNSLTQAPILSKQSNSENTYATLTVGYYADVSGNLVAGTPGVVYYHSQNGVAVLNSGSTTVSAGTWTHIAVSFNSSGASLYINGVLAGSASGNFSQPNDLTVTSTRLGSWSTGGFLDGHLDEVRVWNVVRTQSQIQALMGVGLSGSHSGLVTLYSADQGIPTGTNTGLTILIDNTTNNNHGVLTNFAMSGATSNYIASSVVLPVSLTGFSLVKQADNIVLHWQTSQEQNSGYYIVERSSNGINWNAIGKVRALGASVSNAAYLYTDEQPLQGANYYRLKAVDVNNRFTYSGVIFASFAVSKAVWQVLQNPVQKGVLQFTTKLPATAHAKVQLFDAQGKLLQQQGAYPGLNTMLIQSPVRGIYFLRLSQDGKVIGRRQKIVLQ
ncbi:T9SS type A sorting domain-containing protein [Niastella caeni]|uniref:T9SS type A sorting domain-containing protein n=1 Tax=Niastella caeni TaxID=2569763 RepID=A0A4S8HWT7_9BACT|nr:LamG-like jellyroll fold domain-containing protein [Niastella caeni]THU40163.1 T9SS type A sorting domain-containing protein [Niastella caeni]